MKTAERSYHHGNLKDALITAAAELIEEHGSLDFSITDAARRAGVSNAAPYRHFKDKEDLLLNVRRLAFMGLHERLSATVEAPGMHAGSIDTVVALGLAYLQYTREKRAFFSVMWEDRGRMDVVRADAMIKTDGFRILVNAVEDFCRSKGHLDDLGRPRGPYCEPVSVATQLWALAHGIATLEANQMLDLFDRSATAENLLSESTRALLVGLQLDRPPKRQASTALDHSNQQVELPL